MPAMLGDIVVQLLAETGDIDLLGRSAEGQDALDAATAAGADLLIVCDDDAGAVASFRDVPNLRILWIAADGHKGTIVKIANERVTLNRTSVARIASSILGHHAAGHA